jgi:hypothetical protein
MLRLQSLATATDLDTTKANPQLHTVFLLQYTLILSSYQIRKDLPLRFSD